MLKTREEMEFEREVYEAVMKSTAAEQCRRLRAIERAVWAFYGTWLAVTAAAGLGAWLGE